MVEQLSVRRDLPIASLLSAFGPNLEFAKDLASYTSFKTGGKARYFISAETPGEVAKSVRAARKLGIPCFLLGGGTNVLVADEGYDGVIIKVDIKGLSLLSDTEIDCGAGEELMALVDFATANALAGLEFAAGIWGTVGGAIYGNAGAFGSDIGSTVSSVTLVDREGEEKTVTPEYCRFGYRDSYLKTTKEVILKAVFKLTAGDPSAIRARVDDILRTRAEKHPVDGKSAGCFFKNVPDLSQPRGKLAAGQLLDEVGAKGLQVGGARVFDKHANIIVNTGGATSKDIRNLADIMKKKVIDKFGISLEEEVVQIGNF
jgi:UDP-N-acetylmuramate dehydrogenase